MNTRALPLILTFLCMLPLRHAHAAGPANSAPAATAPANLQRALDHQLNKHLTFPLLAREHMIGEVFVSFVIDKEGRVEVVHCASDNEDLKAYVLRKLSRVDIGVNAGGMWKTTSLRIIFRPERS